MANTPTKYRADVDGLRAIAVLSVIFYHAFPKQVGGGFVGVDVFFVISGFLITSILLQGLQNKTFQFSQFYARRIKRIFPSLIVILFAALGFGWFALLGNEYEQLGKHVASGAGFISNFTLWSESGYFDKTAELKPLLHLWSLGIEEQFYIFWPAILWLIFWKRKYAAHILATLILLSFVANIWQSEMDLSRAFYLPYGRFWELWIGAFLAILKPWPKFKGTASHLTSIVGFFLIVVGVLVISRDLEFPGWWALLPTFGTALVILSEDSWLNRKFLSWRPLVAIGLISYPLYLWHWPLLSYARIVQGEEPTLNVRLGLVALSFLLAWLTYLFVEKPIRFKGWRPATPVLIGLMLMGFVAGALTYENHGWTERSIVKRNVDPNEAVSLPAVKLQDCSFAFRFPKANKVCQQIILNTAAPTWVVWADSSSSGWWPVIASLAEEKKRNLILFSHPSCPPLIAARKTLFASADVAKYCSDGKTQDEILELIHTLRPDLIFLIAAWNSYSPYSHREFVVDQENVEANPVTTQAVIEKRVPETILRLKETSPVLIFRSWPILEVAPNYGIDRISWLQGPSFAKPSSFVEFEKDSAAINTIFKSFADSKIVFFDPSAKICGQEGCAVTLNGFRLYTDTYHISHAGAMQFQKELSVAVDKALKGVD